MPRTAAAPSPGAVPSPGEERVIEGRLCVYYGGYWIRTYEVPSNSLEHKKQLIEALTRRLFNHAEHGINIPGHRLQEARRAFEQESDLARRRVNGAMLAGALFNRATDIFKKVVEMQELGLTIHPDNPLLEECGELLKEAFQLSGMVMHHSGEEGIDELWGEPLKAFSFPVAQFYESRYVKIAQTMAAIDRICAALRLTLGAWPMYAGIEPRIDDFARVAKMKCETLRTDPDIFTVWPSFVVSREALAEFEPRTPSPEDPQQERMASAGRALLRETANVVTSITRARVTMPKTTAKLLLRMERLREL